MAARGGGGVRMGGGGRVGGSGGVRMGGGSAGRSNVRMGGGAGRPGGGGIRMGGGLGGGHMPRPPIHHGGHHHHHYHPRPFFGGGWGWRRPRPVGYGSGCGCFPAFGGMFTIGIIIILVILFSIAGNITSCATGGFGSLGSGGGSNITVSTVKREPLPPGAVNETAYYTDELGIINSSSKLTAGMKNFYKATGIQPYLYTTGSIFGTSDPTADDMERFAEMKYEELFTDSAHVLVVFFQNSSQYNLCCTPGRQAQAVLDNEATDIIMDYIDYYYPNESISIDDAFSKSFDDAGNRIMNVAKSPWPSVLMILGVVVVVLLLYNWWNKSKKQKNLEAQQTENILNKSLDTFGGSEAEELAKKYDNN